MRPIRAETGPYIDETDAVVEDRPVLALVVRYAFAVLPTYVVLIVHTQDRSVGVRLNIRIRDRIVVAVVVVIENLGNQVIEIALLGGSFGSRNWHWSSSCLSVVIKHAADQRVEGSVVGLWLLGRCEAEARKKQRGCYILLPHFEMSASEVIKQCYLYKQKKPPYYDDHVVSQSADRSRRESCEKNMLFFLSQIR